MSAQHRTGPAGDHASAPPVQLARRQPTKLAAVGLLGLWIAVAALPSFVPKLPQAGLDASWVAAMGEGADRGLRWGVDVAFTYGPASPLVTLYGNAAYLILTVPLRLLISLLFAACAVVLTAGVPRLRHRFAALLALALVAAAAGSTQDAMFLALPLLPVLMVLSPAAAGRSAAGLAAATAAVVGATGVAKLSFLLGALPMFVVADLATLARRRRPVLLVPFAAGFVLADVAYGQALSDLPAFLHLGGEVVAGYSEAMALDGSRRELVLFVLTAAALLALVALAERHGRAPAAGSRIALPLCFATASFMMFKAGFVRQDLHTLIAWNGLALAAVVVAPARLWRWRPAIAGTVAALAVGGIVLVDVGMAAPAVEPSGRFGAALAFARDRLFVGPIDQVEAALALAVDPAGTAADLAENRAEAWRAVAEANPLPALSGGVDALPSVQSAIIAAGLDYRPRPSFQEYSTYTEALAAANRAFMTGPRAPDWILFGPEPGSGALSIDHRYPNFAEGSLWPDLLRLYAPDQRIGDLLALRRRASPAALAVGPPKRLTARLDEEIPLDGDGPVFATLDIRPTLLGRLAGLLFRAPPLVMTASFADGHRQAYQFISGLGRSGFVLSPLVADADGFAALAEGTPAPADRRVVGVTLHAPPRLRGFFAPDIAVDLRPMTIDAAALP